MRRKKKYIIHGDGKHNNAVAFNAYLHGKKVYLKNGRRFRDILPAGIYVVQYPLKTFRDAQKTQPPQKT